MIQQAIVDRHVDAVRRLPFDNQVEMARYFGDQIVADYNVRTGELSGWRMARPLTERDGTVMTVETASAIHDAILAILKPA